MKRYTRKRPKWLRVVREPLAHAEYLTLNAIKGQIRAPGDVHRLLGARASVELQEVFWVVLLGAQSQVVDLVEVSRGILNSTLVHPREIFAAAIEVRAAGVILAHNHPSGDATPSADDRAVTRQLVEAGRLLDIPVCDHVILTGDRYVSFAEAGLL